MKRNKKIKIILIELNKNKNYNQIYRTVTIE